MTALTAPHVTTLATPSDDPPRLDTAVWHRILTHVRLTNPTLNRTWFTNLQPRQLPNGVIQVACGGVAELTFLSGSCQQAFNAAAQAVTNRLSLVVFHSSRPTSGLGASHGNAAAHASFDVPPLSPDFAFEHFVVGPDNRLPHAAGVAVADKPGAAYNPLFVHGGIGLGKTHLLQAICQRLLDRQPQLRIVYLTCDAFINTFVNALEANDMNAFRQRFRNADLLAIDDIQFLKGRDRTQEEFFHTFNTLHQHQKQIILSSDSLPCEIPELEERLVSRFNSGLVARLEKPGFETRLAIVRGKARLRGLELADDVLHHIAEHVDTNARELEGAVTKLQGLSQLAGGVAGEPGPINLALARQVLGSVTPEAPVRVTIDAIVAAVCEYYGVKQQELQGKRRNRSIAFPRQVCMFLARRHTRYSLDEIGTYFGGRDHTTVLHGVRQVTNLLATNAEVGQQVHRIEQQVRPN